MFNKISYRSLARMLMKNMVKLSSLCSRLRGFFYGSLFLECGSRFFPGTGFEVASPCRISVGSDLVTGKNVRFHAWPVYAGKANNDCAEALLKIGSGVFINDSSYITAAYGIQLGDHCLVGSNVLITDNSHGQISLDMRPRIQQPLSTKGKVVIGRNVWICNNVVITSGVVIGDGCIIAANSVVTKSFPPASLVAGVPARLVRALVET